MKAQCVSCACNFVRGLVNMGDEEEISPEQRQQGKEIIMLYIQPLVAIISEFFALSIETSYAPLQEETLALLCCIAESLSE